MTAVRSVSLPGTPGVGVVLPPELAVATVCRRTRPVFNPLCIFVGSMRTRIQVPEAGISACGGACIHGTSDTRRTTREKRVRNGLAPFSGRSGAMNQLFQ